MLISALLLGAGIIVLVVSADQLVRGSSDLANRYGVSPLVVGLTVVAFGTSAPELFVSTAAALKGSADVAIGNVIGSNIFNILVIVGIAALLAPVQGSREVTHREMPIMLIAMAMFWGSAAVISPRVISSGEGIVLFLCLVLYLAGTFVLIRSQRTQRILEKGIAAEVAKEGERETKLKDSLRIIGGLIGLIFGADIIVDNGIVLAQAFGVSEFVIAVTLIAGGTSLPELATTAIAAARKQHALAIGNAVGSNIFNVFCVIGITASIQPLEVAPGALRIDFPLMFASCAVVWFILLLRGRISRVSGVVLLSLYVLYIGLLLTRGSM